MQAQRIKSKIKFFDRKKSISIQFQNEISEISRLSMDKRIIRFIRSIN